MENVSNTKHKRDSKSKVSSYLNVKKCIYKIAVCYALNITLQVSVANILVQLASIDISLKPSTKPRSIPSYSYLLEHLKQYFRVKRFEIIQLLLLD